MLTGPTTQSLSRRSSFRLAGYVALGVVAAGSLAGCSSDDGDDQPKEIDPLVAVEAAARRDAAAASAAVAVVPDRAAALQAVAAERTQHADALQAEVARAAGKYPDGTTPDPETESASPSAAPGPPPSLDAVRASLSESQRAASDLARTSAGFRAGLLGSISAACAVEQAVLLG